MRRVDSCEDSHASLSRRPVAGLPPAPCRTPPARVALPDDCLDFQVSRSAMRAWRGWHSRAVLAGRAVAGAGVDACHDGEDERRQSVGVIADALALVAAAAESVFKDTEMRQRA